MCWVWRITQLWDSTTAVHTTFQFSSSIYLGLAVNVQYTHRTKKDGGVVEWPRRATQTILCLAQCKVTPGSSSDTRRVSLCSLRIFTPLIEIDVCQINVRSYHSVIMAPPARNSWASTRQTLGARPSAHRSTDLCVLAMVWVGTQSPTCALVEYGTASGFVHLQPKPGPQFTVLLWPG